MESMSDSQFEFEDKYDDDFYDDESGDENNNQNDSGMEEKHGYHNQYDSPLSGNESLKKKSSSLRPPKKTIKLKDKSPMKSNESHNSSQRLNNNSNTRRAHSDPRGRKPKKTSNCRGASNMNDFNSSMLNRGGPNIVIKRVLSASRNKAKALHNVIYELQQQVEQLTVDNRDLKRSARIQDRELHKLDNSEAQLPALIKKHSTELNVIQEKYKRQKDVISIITENTKKLENELLKTKDKLKQFQSMVKEKNLGERIDLKNTVANLKKVNEEKDNMIAELNRSVALQKKTHGRMLKEKNAKYEKVMERIKLLEDVQKDLVGRLKDREKALEVTNIYSRRALKDGKQSVVFSPRDPLAPILKKCLEEDMKLIEMLGNKSPEKNDNEAPAIKQIVGTDKEVFSCQGQADDLSIRTEQTTAAYVREENLKNEESVDFYDIHDGKDTIKISPQKYSFITSPGDVEVNVSPRAAEKKESDIAINYFAEQQLHVKMNKMNERNDTLVYKEKDKAEQTQLEKGVEEILIGDGRSPKPNPMLDEEAKKRKLLLAKIQAIDDGENPDNVTQSIVNLKGIIEKKSNPKKKPIFLEGSPKSLSNSSEDDMMPTKSLDSNSNNSKPNLDNLKFRRNRPFPNQQSGNEMFTTNKKSDRKNSWEFKITDENLHKGLPAYLDAQQPHSNRTLPLHLKYNDHSLTGSLGQGSSWDSSDMSSQNNSNMSSRNNSDLTDTFSGNKNKIQQNKNNKNCNIHSRIDARYSPTAVEVNLGQDKKINKRNGLDLFDQFEDPFKESFKSTNNKSENTISFPPLNTDTKKFGKDFFDYRSNKTQDMFMESKTVGRTPDSRVDDEIEEMLIT